jgi:branched-chain amino acid transport system substrate-binding protein
MSAAFSGPSRGLGIELYRGSQAYFASVNAAEGVNGRRIMIEALDDRYDPLLAINNTIRFSRGNRVLALFNYVGTPTVTRILPLLRKFSDQNLFLFFPFTGAQPQRQPPYDVYVFNLRASYKEETAGLVENFLKIGRKRIGIFYQIDAYGRSGWDGVRRALSQNGLKIAAEATYRRGTHFNESMKAQVEILRNAGSEAVVSVGTYEPCAAFIRDARDTGWAVPIANVSFVGSENLASTLLAAGTKKGTDYMRNLINSQVVPSYEQTSLSAINEYRTAMNRYNPQLPVSKPDEYYKPLAYSFVSLEGYLNAKLFAEILKRINGPVHRSTLKQAAETIGQVDLGIDAPVQFSANNHQGLHTIYYTTLVNGKFVPLDNWQRFGATSK